MTQRLMVTNRIMAAITALSASSAQTSAPVRWIADQLRSKGWRSKVGWNIVTGFSNKLDFTEGVTGDATATLAAGNYATGAALATELQTRINAAATDNTYTVSYSSTTNKFTIARDVGSASFGLEWSTGAEAEKSCGIDIGFDTSADDTGATSYVGDNAAYKSRELVKADLGSALSVQAAAVINHNIGASGTITLQGNTTDPLTWVSPTVDQALAGDADIRAAYISTQTLRYWRLVVDDVSTNTNGYTEIGVWFAGPYTEPSVCDAVGRTKTYEQLSEVAIAISGAHFQDERAQRPVWSIQWRELEEADRAALQAALYAVPRGTSFFFGFDDTDATDTEYVFLAEGWSEVLTTGLYTDIPVPALAGALG